VRIVSVSPNRGSALGGTSVTIDGSGFMGATGVEFGSRKATSFSVASDGSISAVAPAGSGAVPVRVSTPAGSSSTSASDVLPRADSTFEQGPGSWQANVNAVVAASGSRPRTGTAALELRPLVPGFDSAISGTYPAGPGAEYRTAVWVRAGRAAHVHSFIIFYGAAGQVLSIEQAPVFSNVPRRWTRLSLAAVSPEGTAFVATGVDDADGEGPVYLDDATLTASVRFRYEAG
jgi:hypothetical protein